MCAVGSMTLLFVVFPYRAQIEYHREFEESRDRGYTFVSETADMERLRKNQELVSQVRIPAGPGRRIARRPPPPPGSPALSPMIPDPPLRRSSTFFRCDVWLGAGAN